MNAAEIARKMETDAVEFYSKAAETCSSPAGKRIFLSIMEDEKRHIEMINAIIKGMGIDEKAIDPMDKIKSVFEQMKGEMQDRIAASSSDKEALEVAMKMEKEGFEFYKKSAAAATDAKSKALFERLIKEEGRHYSIFSNTLNFLSDTGNWFMWEEKGIVEG